MISIAILRIHDGKELSSFSWKELLFFTNTMSINMLGFSKREVEFISMSEHEINFKIIENLVDEFLLALSEASSTDFTYRKS
jgi:hypothetical protein